MSMSDAFSISLYFNKTVLHKSSEQSGLATGPRLNSSPLEAKNPSVFHSSAATFQREATAMSLQTTGRAEPAHRLQKHPLCRKEDPVQPDINK